MDRDHQAHGSVKSNTLRDVEEGAGEDEEEISNLSKATGLAHMISMLMNSSTSLPLGHLLQQYPQLPPIHHHHHIFRHPQRHQHLLTHPTWY